MSNKWPEHYRVARWVNEHGIHITVEKFRVIRETPKCYWVVPKGTARFEWAEKLYKRRVSKTSVRRYCYPSIQEAFESFKHRNNFWISRLEYNLAIAKKCQEKMAYIEAGVHDENKLVGSGFAIGRPDIFDDFTWE